MQNISDIAELGLDNPEIYENLLNALEEMGGDDEDSEVGFQWKLSICLSKILPTLSQVNTPPTSPLSPENRIENTSNEVETEQKHLNEEIQMKKTINPVLDKLATIVNSTIKDVTQDFENAETTPEPEEPEASINKRKRKTSPRKAQNCSKAVKKAKVGGGLGYLAKQCRTLLQSEEMIEPQTSHPDKPATSSTPLVLKLAQVARSSAPLPPLDVKEENEGVVCTPDQAALVGSRREKRRGPRCKKCPGCLRDDCGECRTCRDKPKYGGVGILKQACLQRNCQGIEDGRKEGVNLPEAGNKENSETVSMPSPGHVRSLMFSPPTPQKSVLKTLTPEKNSSPIKRTSSAWNTELKDIFSEPAAPIQSAIPFTEEVIKGLNRPITVNRRIHIPIALPSESRLVPIPASAIPTNAAITTLPPGFKSLGFQAIMPQAQHITSQAASSSTTNVLVNSDLKKLTNNSDQPSTPMVSLESNALREVLKSPSPPLSEQVVESSPPFTNTQTSLLASSISVPSSTVATSSMPVARSTSSSMNTAPLKPKSQMSWDEKLRASLGSAEKDMSHISHRLQPREKGRRRSPRKRRPVDKPESEDDDYEDDDEDEDGEDNGGNAPVLDLNDATLTPDAQKILDTFANKLLVKLEENVAMNVVQVDDTCKDGGKKKHKGKSGKRGSADADCICCKLEAVSSRSKKQGGGSGRSSGNSSANTSGNTAAVATSSVGGMPIIASPAKAKTPRSSGKRSSAKKSVGETSVENSKEATSKDEAMPDPDKAVEPEPSKSTPPGPVEKPDDDDQLDSLIQSFDNETKDPSEDVPAPPMTPKKSDTFLFKTPIKTPRRHIPPSPLQHLLSPHTSRMAVPLTPGRPATPSYAPSLTTPAKSGEKERTRHPSSLDTPVLGSPPKDLPVTPTGKVKGVAYFTPSPSSQPSPVATPGLRFLQEEGQRLSEGSEDSQSPEKARELQGKRKSFRNLFKKTAAESEELGTILENKLTSIMSFKTATSTPGTPYMSPAANYTASPQVTSHTTGSERNKKYCVQITLGRPCPSPVCENLHGMERHVSINPRNF